MITNRDAGPVGFSPLWLTAYGHQMLSSMGLELSSSEADFEQVKAALNDLGFEVETTESDDPVYPPTKMSDELREYIWHMAHYNQTRVGYPRYSPSSR